MNRIDIKLAIDMVVNAEENLFAGEADHLINTLEKCGNTIAAQAAVIGKLREAIKAVEIDSEEVLDFDEFIAMMVPMDTYHALIEALPIPDDSAQVLKEWLDSVMGEPVAYMNGSSSVISSKQKQDVLADADLGGEFASAALTASKYSAPLFRKPEVTK